MFHDYYSDSLSAERLRECYDIATPRVKQYLKAEIDHVLERIDPSSRVLELGCGYGRVLHHLLHRGRTVVGVDTSRASLKIARRVLQDSADCHLVQMNAGSLGFRDRLFDNAICIQNGISALKVEPKQLLAEAIRVTKPKGTVLFSSYSERFWKDRLKWFEIQSERGLVGKIDYGATGDGVIVCDDGFRATTAGSKEFASLAAAFGLEARITEVDESSIFCEIVVP